MKFNIGDKVLIINKEDRNFQKKGTISKDYTYIIRDMKIAKAHILKEFTDNWYTESELKLETKRKVKLIL